VWATLVWIATQFHRYAPNPDSSYFATWRGSVCLAFVINVVSRRTVGWMASTSTRSNLALDALGKARDEKRTARLSITENFACSTLLFIKPNDERKPASNDRSAGGAIRRTTRWQKNPSKTEVIYHDSPCRGFDDVKIATMK